MAKTTTVKDFIAGINDAFSRGDNAYVLDRFTDDIRWTMVGESTTEGKQAVTEGITQMEGGPLPTIQVDRTIVSGTDAVCIGSMTMVVDGAEKTYAFSDVYRLTDAAEPRIRELTSFVIETAG